MNYVKTYQSTMSKEDRQVLKQVTKIRGNIRGADMSLADLITRVGEEHPLNMLAKELRDDLANALMNVEVFLDVARETLTKEAKL